MRQHAEIRKGVFRVILFAFLAFFLLPGISLLFTGYVEHIFDRDFEADTLQQIETDLSLSPAKKEEARVFIRTHPLSKLSEGNSPSAAEIREHIYKPFSKPWQFHLIQQMSLWTCLVGAITLLVILLLGAIAFKSRQAQFHSFTLGWNLLTLVSAGEVLVQGTMAVWLSFWLPAFFIHRFFPKFILIIGALVALAVFAAIVNIFKRPPEENEVHGELLTDEHAPELWAHIRALAEKIGIHPPAQIIAGIDDNFFVTEAPLLVGERKITGRSLFVSLPLLRLLEQREADAVFMHELAHLHGGDTESSAALAPKLIHYDHYCAVMQQNPVTRIAYYPMVLYRTIFEFALQRDNRERESMADSTAAEHTSPEALVISLLKINAYSCYRAETERKLFSQNMKFDGTIGIAEMIASGLPGYATSASFLKDMQTANIPHPFHSHPLLSVRMQMVGYQVDEPQYGEVVTRIPEKTWVDDIRTADEIEQRLWAEYERAFAENHERVLAYRYEPATDQEAAIVLKYFPPVVFQLKGEKRIEVTYAGMQVPEFPELLPWDNMRNLEYKDGIDCDVLLITLTEKGPIGHKTTKIRLPGIGSSKERFKATLGKYRQRHQVMRAAQAAAEKEKAEVTE